MLIFTKQPLTRQVARSIRSGTRVARPSLDGHRFDYSDLQELWATEDAHHAVLTHAKDPVWQYWRLGQKGWSLVNVATTRTAVQSLAANEEILTTPAGGRGTYVVACQGDRKIRVRCTSAEGPDALSGVFTRLGYQVHVDEVP